MGNTPKRAVTYRHCIESHLLQDCQAKTKREVYSWRARLCFENRLADLSPNNLRSRSYFSEGGTSGSCPKRDSQITERQHSRGKQYDNMTPGQLPPSHFSQWLSRAHHHPDPSPACRSELGIFGACPQLSRSVPAQGSAGRNAQASPRLRLQKPRGPRCKGGPRSPGCCTMSLRPGKGRWYKEKTVAQVEDRENSWDLGCDIDPISSLFQVLPG